MESMQHVFNASQWPKKMKNSVALYVVQKVSSFRPDFCVLLDELCSDFTNENFGNIILY